MCAAAIQRGETLTSSEAVAIVEAELVEAARIRAAAVVARAAQDVIDAERRAANAAWAAARPVPVYYGREACSGFRARYPGLMDGGRYAGD